MDKTKKQVVVIGGGEVWNTYEEYLEYLKNKEFDPYDTYDGGWKHTLQQALGDEYEVLYIKMPSRNNAKYIEWKIWFEKLLPFLRDDVILVGHSLGANFLVKYLSENDVDVSISQLHLVAGCYGIGGGFELPESLSNIEKQCAKMYIYHSTDDCVVDFADAKKYEKALPKAELKKFNNRSHFIQGEFPEIVESIQKNG